MLLTMETIYETSYVSVCYLGHIKTLAIRWKSPVTSKQYKKVFEQLLDFHTNYPVENHITDMREQGVISTSDRKWLEKEILPQIFDEHFKHLALIITKENAFKKFYAANIKRIAEQKNKTVNMFSTFEAAELWLEKLYSETLI